MIPKYSECNQSNLPHEKIADRLVEEMSDRYSGRLRISYTEGEEVRSKELSSYNTRVVMVPTIVAFNDPYEDRRIFFEVSLRSVLGIEVVFENWLDSKPKKTLISRWARDSKGEFLRIPELENLIAQLESKLTRAAARKDYKLAAELHARELELEEIRIRISK